MRLARLTPLASIGLLLCCAAGCYRPYLNPYGSPYGSPSAPVQTLTPGGTYAPGGTYPLTLPPGSYSSPTPADSYIQPTPSGTPTFQPGASQSNSPFFGNSTKSPPDYDGGGVPTPFDAGEAQFQQTKPAPIAEDFQLHEQGALEGAGATTSNVAKVTVESAEFLEPLRTQPQEPQPTFAEGVVTVTGSQSPQTGRAPCRERV